MTALSIMSAMLEAELRARGISSISRAECEGIVSRVLERSAAFADRGPMTQAEFEDNLKRNT